MIGRTRIGLTLLLAGCGGSVRSSDVERVHAALEAGATIGNGWGAQQKLVAGDAAELDEFGYSVSVAQNLAIVGGYGESAFAGAAYVFVHNGQSWVQEQKLTSDSPTAGDAFGWSVSVAGDRAVVGAYAADGYRGAAYVFVHNPDGWALEQKLVAASGVELDQFGWSVSLHGEYVLIGAYGRDEERGAAHVFGKAAEGWVQTEVLTAADAEPGDHLGYSVSLGDAVALVGAPADDEYQGAAYVFTRQGEAWREQRKLGLRDEQVVDVAQFGTSVAIAGDRAVIGAHWADDFVGAAYVYHRDDREWTLEQKLVATEGLQGDRFGNAVSFDGDLALIGAVGSDSNRGAAYVFRLASGSWLQEQRLTASDGVTLDLFALSVSLDHGHALIGANYNDQLRGAAYDFALGQSGADERDAGAGDGGAGDAGAHRTPDAAPPTPVRACDANTSCVVERCDRGSDCSSGHCEDGLCCDRTCGPTERCRAALKVAGPDGVCGPELAAALGAACEFDVQCTSGRCAQGVCSDRSDGSGCVLGHASENKLSYWTLLVLVAAFMGKRWR